jgi:hypothetical protein
MLDYKPTIHINHVLNNDICCKLMSPSIGVIYYNVYLKINGLLFHPEKRQTSLYTHTMLN